MKISADLCHVLSNFLYLARFFTVKSNVFTFFQTLHQIDCACMAMVSEKKFLNQLNRPQAAALCPHHRFLHITRMRQKNRRTQCNLCAESKSPRGQQQRSHRHIFAIKTHASANPPVQSTGRKIFFSSGAAAPLLPFADDL